MVYLITERCNYKCGHCYPLNCCTAKEELSVETFLCQFQNSRHLKNCKIVHISGGEPFIRDDLLQLVNGLTDLDIAVELTTNGYFTDKETYFAEHLSDNSKKHLSVRVSIDGMRHTHDHIRGYTGAFERAIRSCTIFKKHGIPISLNTVIQEENIDYIGALTSFISFMDIPVNLIARNYFSYAHDHAENPYHNPEYAAKVFLRISNPIHKKMVLSKNTFRMRNCHAGLKTCVIGANGDVAICLSGYQMLEQNRASAIIGNLKECSFDDLSPRWEYRCLEKTKNCAGCNADCDTGFEYKYFGMDVSLTGDEKDVLKTIFQLQKSNLLYFENWHEEEKQAHGSQRWMSDTKASLFVRVQAKKANKLIIAYGNGMPAGLDEDPVRLSVIINGMTYLDGHTTKPYEKLEIDMNESYASRDILEIQFKTDRIWRPCDVTGGIDNRCLGVVVYSVECVNSALPESDDAVRFVEWTMRHAQYPNTKILDVGCGSGDVVRYIAGKYNPEKIIGIDPYLQADLASVWEYGVSDTQGRNWSLMEGDVENLRFEDNCFDYVVSLNALEHIHDTEKALSEIRRVLKPSGRFITMWGVVWTSVLGHHYHHWIEQDVLLIPPWGHLYMNEEEMAAYLAKNGTDVGKINEVIDFVYRSPAINRHSRFDMLKWIAQSGMYIIEYSEGIALSRKSEFSNGQAVPSELTDDVKNNILKTSYSYPDLPVNCMKLVLQKL